ncbi:MAG: alginate export family protein [Candidatus Omnitrophica bacterium]|nr:alginate export family protein [Candidatus Omnitrophota bacterium]
MEIKKPVFILLGGVFLALFSFNIFAETNIKASGDLTTQSIIRNLSLGNKYLNFGFSTKDLESFILMQTRLKFDAELNEDISATLRFINERFWGAEEPEESLPNNSNIYLDLAYMEISGIFNDAWTITIGRQNLRFGRGFIIGDPDTDRRAPSNISLYNLADHLSLRKSFDALKTRLDYSPLVIDLIYAKIQEDLVNMKDDVTLSGANLGYSLNEDCLIEGYFWVKQKDNRGPNANTIMLLKQNADTRIFTAGLRSEGKLAQNLFLYAEGAYQFGDYLGALAGPSQKIRAFAVQLGGKYRFDDTYSSKIGLEYSYSSTNDGDTTDRFETWDPMFEDQRVGEIAQIFWSRGLQYWKLSASILPRQDLTCGLDFYYIRLTDSWLKGTGSVDAFYGNGLPITNNVYWLNYNKKELGLEIDPYLVYDYTENVQLGLACGFFIPGSMWNNNNKNTAYSTRAYAKIMF